MTDTPLLLSLQGVGGLILRKNPTFEIMKDLLLLLCLYPYDENNRERLLKLIREVNDWDLLVRLINAHGIIALAAYNIKEAGIEKSVPRSAMLVLESGLMKSISRNTWLREKWKEVDFILSSAGIKHVLLKGMVLEYSLYGGKGIRQMNDNDIYVAPESAMAAWELIKEKGFTAEPFKSPLFNKIKPYPGKHLPTLYKEGYAVEIHAFLSENKGSEEQVLNNAIEIKIDNRKAWIPDKETHLRFLIRHFENHVIAGEGQLRLYADISLLGGSDRIEYPEKFLLNPIQKPSSLFHKASYKNSFRSIAPRYRLYFLLGDIFPSLEWMKKRYRCNTFNAIRRYPSRLGKLLWLI